MVNATTLGVGGTLHLEQPVAFPAIPNFAPEHFAVLRPTDANRYKQFRRGVRQLDEEGVVQVLSSDRRGEQAPVLAAVGPMQFDVILHRLAGEFSAPAGLEHLPYTLARRTDPAGATALVSAPGVEVLTRHRDGALLALFPDRWRLTTIQRDQPDTMLEPLIAGTSDT